MRAKIGVGQRAKKRHHLIYQGAGPAVIPGREGYVGENAQRHAAKLEITQSFGDRQGRAGSGFVLIAHCSRGERVPLGEGAFLGQFQGLLNPAVDEGPVRLLDPHPGPLHRLQGEVGVDLG